MRIYTKNGNKYLSVTSILQLMFPFDSSSFDTWAVQHGYDPKWILRESSRIGTLVHSWCENRLENIEWADQMPVTKIERGYHQGVIKFFADIKPTGKSISEFEVYCNEFRYAGRTDGLIDSESFIGFVDYKVFGAWRGKYKEDADKIKKVSIQLSMYKYCLGDAGKNKDIAVVLFKPDGSYEMRRLEYTETWKEWIVQNWAQIYKFLGDGPHEVV